MLWQYSTLIVDHVDNVVVVVDDDDGNWRIASGVIH